MRCSPLVSRKADLVLAVRSDMNVLFVAYNWRMNYNFMWCEQLPKHAFGIAMCYLSWEVILWLKLSAHHKWEDNLAYWLFIISCKYEQTDVSDHVRSICSLFHFFTGRPAERMSVYIFPYHWLTKEERCFSGCAIIEVTPGTYRAPGTSIATVMSQ